MYNYIKCRVEYSKCRIASYPSSTQNNVSPWVYWYVNIFSPRLGTNIQFRISVHYLLT